MFQNLEKLIVFCHEYGVDTEAIKLTMIFLFISLMQS